MSRGMADRNPETAGPVMRTGNSRHLRDLVWHLTKRNFMIRYKGSVLGILWSVIPPLAQLAVLVVVFGTVIPLRIEAYPAFVFTCILPWTWFSASVLSSACLFTANRDLLRNPHFSPWVLVVVETALNLFAYLILLPVLLLVLWAYGRQLTHYLAVFPLLLVIQAVLVSGIGLLIATANVFYRDVQHITGIGVMLLFYVTPVFYQTTAASRYHALFSLNPVAGLIRSYTAIFFEGQAPDRLDVALAVTLSGLLFIAGLGVYRRLFHRIFDLI